MRRPLPPSLRRARYVAAACAVACALCGAAAAGQAPAAHLTVSVVDEATGRPTPVRVRLTDERGRVAPLPASALSLMYGVWDHADKLVCCELLTPDGNWSSHPPLKHDRSAPCRVVNEEIY